MKKVSKETGKMTAHLSSLQIWAFALGTSVGWGSLVVTSNSYLGQAGPWGSALGLILGCLVMICVARNYSYLMRIYLILKQCELMTHDVIKLLD